MDFNSWEEATRLECPKTIGSTGENHKFDQFGSFSTPSRMVGRNIMQSVHWLATVPLPSGKLLHSYGTSPFFMGTSTINRPFSIAFCLFTRG